MIEKLKQWLAKPQTWGYIAAAAIVVFLAFAFFAPANSEGLDLRQHDMIQGQAIGQEAKAYTEATGEYTRWTNSLFSGMPTFQIAPSYPSNRLFDWITTVYGCGLPSPSNLLAMMMIGFLILMAAMKIRWYYALIGAVAWGFSTYFIIIIGAGHIWKFVTLAYIPPTIAGVILCYRGKYLAGTAVAALFAMMQVASNHPQMTYYFLFVILGLVIAALVMAYRRKELAKWGIATACLAGAAALAITANLPSLYNTYEYSKETMRGGHSELSAGSAKSTDGGLDKNYITQYSYGQSELFTLLIPNVKGGASAKPVQGQLQALSMSDLPAAQEMVNEGKVDQIGAQYLQYASQYFGEPEGTNGPVYVGAIIFALFLLGCVIVKGPVKWVLLALTLLSCGLALGRNFMSLTDLFIDLVPMYSKFRTVESILVTAEFTIPILAILGLQKLMTEKDKRRYFKPVMWCFGVPVALCLLGWWAPGFYGSVINQTDLDTSRMIGQALEQQGYPQEAITAFSINNPAVAGAIQQLRYGMIEADALRSLLFLLAAGGVLTLWMLGKGRTAVAVGAVGALVLVDLFTVNKRYLDYDSFCTPQMTVSDPFALTATDRLILQDTTSHYRVMDIGNFWRPEPSYHHKMIGGYHAAKLSRYQDLIDAHIGNFLNGQASEADMNVLNMLNTKYIVTPSGQVVDNPQALGNAWLVDTIAYVQGAKAEMNTLGKIDPAIQAVADAKYEQALGSATPISEGDTIRLTSYAPNRLTYHVDTKRGGLVVFSEVYFPWGWTVKMDGDKELPLGRVNYVLRAVNVPEGAHTLTMTFDPRSLHTTSTAAYIAIILIYLLVLAALALPLIKKEVEAVPKSEL